MDRDKIVTSFISIRKAFDVTDSVPRTLLAARLPFLQGTLGSQRLRATRQEECTSGAETCSLPVQFRLVLGVGLRQVPPPFPPSFVYSIRMITANPPTTLSCVCLWNPNKSVTCHYLHSLKDPKASGFEDLGSLT